MNEEILRKLGYNKQVDRFEVGRCPICNTADKKFRDEQSKREHAISGLCQSCQDKVFGANDDD